MRVARARDLPYPLNHEGAKLDPITPQDIKAFAAELENETDERINLFIEYGLSFVNETKFGRKFKLAHVLITCHLITAAGRGGNGGGVTSESVGELSRSYGQTTGSGTDELATTSFGQQFIALRKTLLRTPLVV